MRIRAAPRSRSATCSSTCRRGASSCVPSAPSCRTSRNGCARWRCRGPTSSCAWSTTAARPGAGARLACSTPRPRWRRPNACWKRWARSSRATRCAWTTPARACACTAGSRGRYTTAPPPTSNTCTSTAAPCATATLPMRYARPTATCCSTVATRLTCCSWRSIRAEWMSTCTRPSTKCVSASRGWCTISPGARCSRHWRRPAPAWWRACRRMRPRTRYRRRRRCRRRGWGCGSTRRARPMRRCTAMAAPRSPSPRRRCRIPATPPCHPWAMRLRNCTASTSSPKAPMAWWWWTCTPRTNASATKSSRPRTTTPACAASRCWCRSRWRWRSARPRSRNAKPRPWRNWVSKSRARGRNR